MTARGLPIIIGLSVGIVAATAASVMAAAAGTPPPANPGVLSEAWTSQFGSDGSDRVTALAVDASGDIYAAGEVFGALPGQVRTGGGDGFLRRYGADGTERWTTQFGTSEADAVNVVAVRGVAVDMAGHVFVAGSLGSTFPDQQSSGGMDAFVSSYDADGALRWIAQFGTPGDDSAEAVAVDPTGNVYATGFADGVFPGQTSTGDLDAFVRSLDVDGGERWTRQFGTPGVDRASGIAVGSSGGVYVTGGTSGTLPGERTAGGSDAFVRSYAADGTEGWVRQFGTPGDESANDIAVASSGDVYVTGATEGAFPGVAAAGGSDGFIHSFAADGAPGWIDQFGTSEQDFVAGVAVDGSGEIHLAGSTLGSLPGQQSAGDIDAYVRGYGPDGSVHWTLQFGTADSDFGFAVAGTRGLAVGGSTDGNLPGQTSAGRGDAFVRSYTVDSPQR